MNKISVLIFCILILVVYWIFWIPGVRTGTDYHFSQNENVIVTISPFVWKEINIANGLGEYVVSTMWSQPLHTLFGTLALLGMSFEIRTKILMFLVLLISFLSIRSLLKFTNVGIWGEFIGSLFYLTNTFFVLLLDGGQLPLALAYGVLPAVILYFLKLCRFNNFLDKVTLSFYILILSILDIRLLFILTIIFCIYFLLQIIFFRNKNLIKVYISIFIIPVFFLIGFHFYWLLPSILTRLPSLPAGYGKEVQVDFLSFSNIGHSIFLQQPHWYKNIFGKITNLNIEFIFIPLLVFTSLFLNRRHFITGFWLVVALVGIFLGKGSQEPFSQVYPWLFTNIPGFSVFRDPVKFYFLISLSFSILLAITIKQVIHLRFNNNLTNKLIKVFPYLVIIYLIWLIRPVYLGQMTGLLSFPIFETEYSNLANKLKQDNNFSRIFWIPVKSPLGYTSSTHPVVEASILSQKRSIAVGIKGTYETFNFLREAPYMGEIFDVAGIGYIAYPFLDSRRDNMHPDNIRYYYTFLNQLSKRPWLSKVENSQIPLFKVKEHQDRFFITPNIWWVIGSDNLYNESTKSANLKLSKNALIFVEEYPDLGNRIDELPQVKIVLNNKTLVDLAASFIKSEFLIFPAKQLGFDPDKTSGWWKREAADLINWRAFLQTKYDIDNQDFDLGGGWAVGEGSLKLKIESKKFKENQILLVRTLESTRSGQLSFYQSDKLVGQINTKREGNEQVPSFGSNIRWFEVGELPYGGELIINSSGEINVVNALAVLDKNEWLRYQDKAKKLEGRVLSFDEVNTNNSNNPTVTYQKINPTKYVVNVSNLTQSAFLVFSQNYDGLWKIDDQTPLPVYSLLNGFKIEKNGQYIVEFEAQKYVYPGLVISGVTVLVLVFWLFNNFRRYKQ